MTWEQQFAAIEETISMATTTDFNWSDLARRSPEVGEALDHHGEVTVRRGSRAYRIAALNDGIEDAMGSLCRLLSAVVTTSEPERVIAILNTAWPWTRVLPPDDQLALAREVGPLAETCESVGTWRPLLESLAAWRGTARAWADGVTPVEPITTVDQPVERPGIIDDGVDRAQLRENLALTPAQRLSAVANVSSLTAKATRR